MGFLAGFALGIALTVGSAWLASKWFFRTPHREFVGDMIDPDGET